MTCAEFQKVLPYIIETGGNAEEEAHVRTCPVCADLVADLRYIAEVAKLLVPMEDPHPRVWDGIRDSLQREGMVRATPVRGRLLSPNRWGAIAWVAAVAALVMIALGLSLYRKNEVGLPRPGLLAQQTAPASLKQANPGVPGDLDDQQLLSQISVAAPSLLPTYQDNLQRVNTYISDARSRLEQDPGDEEARQFLVRAYEQKAMLYEMALSRSLQ